MSERIETVADLKKAYPALCQQIYDNVATRVMDNIDDRIATAIAAEKEKYKKQMENEIMGEFAKQQKGRIEILRQVIEMLSSVPGVIPLDEEGEEEDGDDS